MLSKLITSILILGVTLCLVRSTEVAVGKVTIGTPDEEITEISISELDTDTFITVYLQVIYVNETTSAVLDLLNNVTLTCDLTPGWSGYSHVDFESVIVIAPNISTPNFTTEPLVVRIPYSNLSAGRPTSVRCWGVSIIEQVGANQTVPRTQFTKESSMSEPVPFVVRRKGTVNICVDIVLVPNKESDSRGTFLVELSETVKDHNVTISCRSAPLNISDAEGALKLTFSEHLLRPGERKVLVGYVVVQYGEAILVSCAGQSIYIEGNDTKNGSQFQFDTSRGEPVVFVLEEGVVQIIPETIHGSTSNLKIVTAGISIKLFLVLDAPVTSDVSFTCTAETVNTTEEAMSYAENTYCKKVSYVRPIPPPLEPVDPGNTSRGAGVNLTAPSGGIAMEMTAEGSTSESSIKTSELTFTDSPTNKTNTTDEGMPCYALQEVMINETDIVEMLVRGTLANVTMVTKRLVNTTVEVNCTELYTTKDSNLTNTAANFTDTDSGNPTTSNVSFGPTVAPCYEVQDVLINVTDRVEMLVNGSLTNVTMVTERLVNTTVEVNCTETFMPKVTTATPLQTTVAPGNATPSYKGEWFLDRPSYEFKVGGTLYDTITLERSFVPPEPLEEKIVIRCCAPDTNRNPKYWGSNAAVLVLASLSPRIPINWTIATPEDKATLETPIQNPAYVEVAPCPCDIKKDGCDADCCCDKLCSEQQKETFTCVSGVEGGFSPPPPGYSCSSKPVVREDWYPFMCVHQENTAFLGYFYDPTPALRTDTEIDEKTSTNKPDHSYRETGKRSDTGEKLYTGYKSGLSVKVGLSSKTVDDISTLDNQYRLALPQRTLQGKCANTAPVQFLVDVDNDCVQQMARDLCTESSSLSALVYAQATDLTNPPCPRAPFILRAQGLADVARVTTHYLCSKSAADYLRSTARAEDVYGPTKKYLFSSDLPRDTMPNCDFDAESGVYACEVSDDQHSDATAPRCTWDDGYTRPPAPFYNETTNICHNAVVDVYYNFTWEGAGILNAGNVTSLNATLILADVPMEVEYISNFTYTYVEAPEIYKQSVPLSPIATTVADSGEVLTVTSTVLPLDPTTPGSTAVNPISTETMATNSPTETPGTTVPPGVYVYDPVKVNTSVTVTNYPAMLSQRFKAIFWHSYRLPNITQDEDTSGNNATSGSVRRTDRYKRSGKPGYDFGLPVISGVVVRNGSDFTSIDSNTTWRLSVWEAVAGGLCEGAGRSIVQFGVGSTSSCMLRLGLSELHNDCNYLRKLVLHHQDALMSSTHVSRTGDPDHTDVKQWTRVIRENISHIIPPDEPMTTSPSASTEVATATVSITTETVATVNDATTATSNDTVTDPPWILETNTIGKCPNIPSSIHVDVMYAQVGAVNAQPVFEIVGSKVSYTLSTWQLACSGSSGMACRGNRLQNASEENSEFVQTFLLTSSVNFIEVPPLEPAKKTRRQAELGDQGEVCMGDACWEELFYPFMRIFQGDPFMYTMTVSLASVIFIIALFMISRPWW